MTQNQDSSLWDKIWKDKTGNVVLWQNPNLPLWSWITTTAFGYFIKRGYIAQVLDILALGSLITWAYLEARSGVNFFRRFLGILVLVYLFITHILVS